MSALPAPTPASPTSTNSTYNWSTHEFVVPQKRISSMEDLRNFTRSRTHDQLMGFIRCLNDTVIRVPTTSECFMSEATKGVLNALDTLATWADQVEPLKEPSRFGNKAFRIWHDILKQKAPEVHQSFLQPELHNAVVELCPYFIDSFGNYTRMDYGTGHELHFVAWLFLLCTIGYFTPRDHMALVIRVFTKYLDVVRKVQRRYNLEPAGSHGVWGLDDYQFIPFIWGAAQLIDHPEVQPGSILSPVMVEKYCKDYLYLSCIKYTTDVKKGPFHEHSPDLYNISAAASWRKINTGMQKKYSVEVINKFPVIQHFLFGSVLVWTG